MAFENDTTKILPSPSAARLPERSWRRVRRRTPLVTLIALICIGLLTQFGTSMLHVAELLTASSAAPVRSADPDASPESAAEAEVVALIARSRVSAGQERATARFALMWPLAQHRIDRRAADREPPARVRPHGYAAQRIPLRC
jgi:hypothetical protein